MFEDPSSGTERPGIEEQYETATNTSDLSVIAHRRGAADILIAAAWSETRLGGALLRLHSQWESAEKPVRQVPRPLKHFLADLPRDKAEEAHRREVERYAAWYMNEMAVLLGGLSALPAVREQLTLQALKWGMGAHPDPLTRAVLAEQATHDEQVLAQHRKAVEDAESEAAKLIAQAGLNAAAQEAAARRAALWRDDEERATAKASAVIRYWLDQTCQTCDGRRFRVIQGTPTLSNKACPACSGSGIAQVPHGQEGKRLANYLDGCVHRARQGIRNRLRSG